MISSPSFFFISSLLLVFLLHGTGHVHGDANLIDETCKKAVRPTLGYDFCVASLKADPKSQTADLQGLGIIGIELTIKNATMIASHIKGILDTLDQPKLRASLVTCLEIYTLAVPNANDAIQAFQSKDYRSAGITLSGVLDSADTCEDSFKDLGLSSPVSVSKEGHVFEQLAEIPLVITTMFK